MKWEDFGIDVVDCARVGWMGLRRLVTDVEVRRRQGYACIVKVIVIL